MLKNHSSCLTCLRESITRIPPPATRGVHVEPYPLCDLFLYTATMPITVGTLGKLHSVTQRNREVVFSFESSELIVTAVLPNVIRHTWVPTHWRLYTHRGFDTHAVQRRSWPATPVPILTETAATVRVQLGELCLEATR